MLCVSASVLAEELLYFLRRIVVTEWCSWAVEPVIFPLFLSVYLFLSLSPFNGDDERNRWHAANLVSAPASLLSDHLHLLAFDAGVAGLQSLPEEWQGAKRVPSEMYKNNIMLCWTSSFGWQFKMDCSELARCFSGVQKRQKRWWKASSLSPRQLSFCFWQSYLLCNGEVKVVYEGLCCYDVVGVYQTGITTSRVCVQLTYGNVSPANLLQCARQPVVVYLPAMSLQPVLERRATGGLLVWQSHTQ